MEIGESSSHKSQAARDTRVSRLPARVSSRIYNVARRVASQLPDFYKMSFDPTRLQQLKYYVARLMPSELGMRNVMSIIAPGRAAKQAGKNREWAAPALDLSGKPVSPVVAPIRGGGGDV